MADVIQLFKHNYPYVICAQCGCDLFIVKTVEIDGGFYFGAIVCNRCENEIHVDLKPLYQPTNTPEERA